MSEPPLRTRTDSNSKFNGRRMGTELFDISEDMDYGVGVEDSLMGGDSGFPAYPYQYGQEENTFYSPSLGPGPGLGVDQRNGLNDPFSPLPLPGGLDTIKEREVATYPYYPYPQGVSLFSPYPLPTATTNSASTTNPNACSVCGRSNPNSGPKAILIPCSHPLCSACLTSALNIVGEKDMECSVCKKGVEDFKLVGALSTAISSLGEGKGNMNGEKVGEGEGGMEGGGKEMSSFDFFEDVRARSSPPFVKPAAAGDVVEDVVLRIDNVPWVHLPFHIRVICSLTN